MERAIWIVHGDAQARTVLARMAGMPAQSGPPRLDAFPETPAPGAIVLHVPLVANDALAFAHTTAARYPRAAWLLIADPSLSRDWLLGAFTGLRTTLVPWPPQPAALQQALRQALAGGGATRSALRQRDALVARFARTLGDLAIPEPVLDASGHLAITGERGVGKLLLARTLHALWDAAADEGRAGFVLLAGDASATGAKLEARLAESAERCERIIVCVEDPAALTPTVQREVATWIELGPPEAGIDPLRLLWVFLRPESFGGVAPLADALAELCESPALRIPPLRERPGAALRLAEQWLREWYAAKDEPLRALAPSARDAIAADPWPDNARELEAALRRAVASPGAAPIEASALGLAAPDARDAVSEALRSAAKDVPTAGDARDFSSVIEELDAARESEAAGEGYEAPRDEPAAGTRVGSNADRAVLPEAPPVVAEPTPSAASADLRAFARAAARDLAPAREALRSRGDEPGAARLARRLARFEQFASLDAKDGAESEAAPLLAALLAERRDELLAKRLLVLRELESDDTKVRADETALRFALGALLDALLEAAPHRTDLYVSARPTIVNGKPLVRLDLRLRNAHLAKDQLDLLLAIDVLARIGAKLTLEPSETESRASIELPR
ncbi:MAG TPA: hypothetical protein VII78_03585 [Myxococcota bacterium]